MQASGATCIKQASFVVPFVTARMAVSELERLGFDYYYYLIGATFALRAPCTNLQKIGIQDLWICDNALVPRTWRLEFPPIAVATTTSDVGNAPDLLIDPPIGRIATTWANRRRTLNDRPITRAGHDLIGPPPFSALWEGNNAGTLQACRHHPHHN